MANPIPRSDRGIVLYFHGAATDNYVDAQGVTKASAVWAGAGSYKDGQATATVSGASVAAVWVRYVAGVGPAIANVTIKLECQRNDANNAVWSRTPLRSTWIKASGAVTEGYEQTLTVAADSVARLLVADAPLSGTIYVSAKGDGAAVAGDKLIIAVEAA